MDDQGRTVAVRLLLRRFARVSEECSRQLRVLEETKAEAQQRDNVVLFENLLEHGFRHAKLSTPPGICDPVIFPVTGGLMSGLRSTSAVGSGWNSVLGETAKRHGPHPEDGYVADRTGRRHTGCL
ncbi:hypothetical protein MTO96_045614 [Rhipicephalus appendiculatus]